MVLIIVNLVVIIHFHFLRVEHHVINRLQFGRDRASTKPKTMRTFLLLLPVISVVILTIGVIIDTLDVVGIRSD